jgi:hypothetical protein
MLEHICGGELGKPSKVHKFWRGVRERTEITGEAVFLAKLETRGKEVHIEGERHELTGR